MQYYFSKSLILELKRSLENILSNFRCPTFWILTFNAKFLSDLRNWKFEYNLDQNYNINGHKKMFW